MKLSRHLVVAAAKLGVFTVVSLIVTGTLVMIMGKFGAGETEEYSAVFSSASLLQKGDDVRVAGVIVGKVREVELVQTDKAKVDFTVAKDLPLTTRSVAQVRYLNLVGDRYLAVEEGDPSQGQRLVPGRTLPESQTKPALDLTTRSCLQLTLISVYIPVDPRNRISATSHIRSCQPESPPRPSSCALSFLLPLRPLPPLLQPQL